MIRLLACFALLLLAACSRPQAPDKERPPEPRAAGPQTAVGKAIYAPIDKARNSEAQVQQAADEQRQAIDEATDN